VGLERGAMPVFHGDRDTRASGALPSARGCVRRWVRALCPQRSDRKFPVRSRVVMRGVTIAVLLQAARRA